MQREFLRNIERGDDTIGGRRSRRGFGDVHGAQHAAESEHRHGDGNSASGPIEKNASDIGDRGGSQRERVARDGDTGGESSRHAERAGEWNLEYRGDLEPERNCGRKHCVRGDLRRGFDSLPDGDEHTAPQVEYLAPGTIPSPNPVSATAVSAADSTKSASAQITVLNHVLVSVQPGSITLSPLAVQGFTASVLGTGNQNVVWQVQGAACSTAGICGTINASGTYTAPSAAPTPDAIQVVAISSDDTSQSGIANVTISPGANILTLHPSSVYAGAAQGFTLRVDGSGFAASSPGPASAVLIRG